MDSHQNNWKIPVICCWEVQTHPDIIIMSYIERKHALYSVWGLLTKKSTSSAWESFLGSNMFRTPNEPDLGQVRGSQTLPKPNPRSGSGFGFFGEKPNLTRHRQHYSGWRWNRMCLYTNIFWRVHGLPRHVQPLCVQVAIVHYSNLKDAHQQISSKIAAY
jgi:hypothetical protein